MLPTSSAHGTILKINSTIKHTHTYMYNLMVSYAQVPFHICILVPIYVYLYMSNSFRSIFFILLYFHYKLEKIIRHGL